MNLKNNLDVDEYLYLDPKFPDGIAPKKTTPFKECILFTVGGGNYIEYHNLKDYCVRQKDSGTANEMKIIYGSTEIVGGDNFLDQLARS